MGLDPTQTSVKDTENGVEVNTKELETPTITPVPATTNAPRSNTEGGEGGSDDDNARNVASHYNARPQGDVRGRKRSPIFKMKSFNNAIKTILINRFCRPRDTVLDFGCGKGGDLQKWDRARVGHVIGIDIAAISIEHAQQRYRELMRRSRLKAEFYVADLFVEEISNVIRPQSLLFDVVSCQFMLHYCFETKAKAVRCLANIAERLRKGGMFIGTIPNANVLVKRLKEAEGLEFGNDIYKIRFDQKDSYEKYGHRYHFYLKDAIDDCPEYLMHFESFRKMAEGLGFRLVLAEPFHEFYHESTNFPRCRELFERQKLIGKNAGLSDDEWEATGLYMAFAFRKL